MANIAEIRAAVAEAMAEDTEIKAEIRAAVAEGTADEAEILEAAVKLIAEKTKAFENGAAAMEKNTPAEMSTMEALKTLFYIIYWAVAIYLAIFHPTMIFFIGLPFALIAFLFSNALLYIGAAFLLLLFFI